MVKLKMKIVRRIVAVATLVFGIALSCFAETVTNVRGSQRPNSNLVDIYYDLNAVDGGTYTVEVAIEGRTNEVTAATFSGDVGNGIAPGKNRHIVWEAGADWRNKKGDVKVIVTAIVEARKGKPKKVQLWEGGPYWADRNIGADNPWDYGLYFWWGDTVGHRPSGTTFSFSFTSANCPTFGKNEATLRSSGWITEDGVLEPSYDAAHVQWGGGWRMPTSQELMDVCFHKCDWIWTTKNGVNGYIVRGRGAYASNFIFLPCAGQGEGNSFCDSDLYGYYWSAGPISGNSGYSWFLYFGSGFHTENGYHSSYGRPVRPVR